jgi:phosphoglycerate dehydrogenase-like enzyme
MRDWQRVKYTVVLTAPFPPARALLAGELDVLEHPAEAGRTSEDLALILGDADAAIVQASDPVTREVLEANPNLRMVAVVSDGGNVDMDAARELAVIVSITADARLAAIDVRTFFRGGPPVYRVV